MDNLTGIGISQRFKTLGELLYAYKTLWTERAFYSHVLAWEDSYPNLAHFLQSLSYESACALQNDDEQLLKAVAPYLPIAIDLVDLIKVAHKVPTKYREYPPHLINGIPGRKLSQIRAFLASVDRQDHGAIVDWCCGKGHLGRLATFESVDQGLAGSFNYIGLEWNSHLVDAGNAYSIKHKLPFTIHCVDVLQAQCEPWLTEAHHVYSLHACGQLHVTLLKEGVKHGCAALYVSPCCYHLLKDDQSPLISNFGKEMFLATLQPLLNPLTIRTAVQQTMTAPVTVRRQRETLQAWRLGFDLLQRASMSREHYVAYPSVPNTLALGTFADFVGYMVRHHKLPMDQNHDWSYWEKQGWLRFYHVTKMDLARMAFRRALEILLVLDRAQYLAEADYHVEVFQFCEQQLTPRNLFIRAVR